LNPICEMETFVTRPIESPGGKTPPKPLGIMLIHLN
jgi:hypothetical protein